MNVVFNFEVEKLEVPVNETPWGSSISKIIPVGNTILVAEYGTVGMLELLNYSRNNTPLKAVAKLMIVGISYTCPTSYPIGSLIIPKMRDAHIIRDTFDPANDYSFDRLEQLASNNKELLAAVSIVANKENSRIGLKLDTTIAPPDVIGNLAKNKSMGDLIYRDKKLPFINFKLMDYTNIDAIIYDNSIV